MILSAIKKTGEILNKYHKCPNQELPLDFDYQNDFGMYFDILSSGENEYKYSYKVEIHFICLDSKKLEMLNMIEKISKDMNLRVDKYWYRRSVNWLIDAKDDEYNHYIVNIDLYEYK